MKNDNAAVDSGVSITLMTLLGSLIITSALISFFVSSVYGYAPAQIGTIDLNFNGYSTTTDFTSNCNMSGYQLVGSWNCGSQGLTLSGQGFLLDNIDQSKVPVNGIFQNDYHLLNPNGDNYYVVISQSTIAGQSIDLYVKSDGLYVISHSTIFGLINTDSTISYIPLSGANQIQDVLIQTSLDSNTPSLSITFNNQNYVITNMGNIDTTNIQASSGVDADNGITIVSMGNTFGKSSQGAALDSLEMISGFIGNVVLLITWNINPVILPWILNILLIKTQEMGILVCLIVIVRG